MICGSGGSKSRLAKAAGAEPAGQMSDEKLHAVVAGSTFRSQNVQNTSAPDHFWKLRCRKKCTPLWHEATFPSKNVQNTPRSDHFWKLRCRKSARRCGAKHISKWKCNKTHHGRTTFGSCDVEKVHAVVARSTFRSQKVQNTSAPDHFWKLRCRKSARRCGAKHISKSMLKTPGVQTTFGGSDVASLHYTTLHTLHYTPLHYTPLQYTTLHNTTTTTTQLHSTTLHYTKLRYITLHYTTLHSTTTTTTTTQLHSTTLHYTKFTLHYITLHYTTFHYTPLHYTTLHYTTLHHTEWHCTTDRQVDR